MTNRNFWEGLFPIERDFYKMISHQGKATANGIRILHSWLTSRSKDDYKLLFSQAEEADSIRFDMEDHLIEAFATPFDRQDIYSLSIEMARIVAYTKSTLQEMEAFAVLADPIIITMIEQLHIGSHELAEAIELLKENPRKAKMRIVNIRKAQMLIEEEYRAGMVALFSGTNVMHAMQYREVYHHIKDAAVHLGYTTDVLHKIVVRVI